MTEFTKTAIFVSVALVALVAAFATRPGSSEVDTNTLVGQTRGNFNPDDAKRLRIARFDEDTATLKEFEVAQEEGLWTIPSKNGYPADAERQMGEATTSVLDREILKVESTSAAQHEEYGVVDPLSPKLEPGQKGVGTRITISDINDKPLVDWIIGKEVKDQPEQRYVREAGRDVVYVVAIDPNKLSTKFDDWIEGDLLKINPWDIGKIQIKDYSAELVPVESGGRIGFGIDLAQRSDVTLRYNDEESKWTADTLRTFDSASRDFADFKIEEGEELNEDKLTELKNALDDLRIVDVARKPGGLSADLRAGDDFLTNPEAARDLMGRGFAPAQTPDGKREIISSEGEVIATMKDGVEYVLRFGELQLEQASGEPSQELSEAAAADAKKNEGLNRYLFAMVRFNEDAVEKPKLEDLPALPEGAMESAEADAATSESSADSAAEAESTETEAKDEAAETAESDEPPADEAADTDTTDQDSELAKTIALRKAIEQENQRKLDEYQATLKRGRERVTELNTRFGDWYYVVSNDVFKKVRLGRHDVIRKKEATDGAEAKQDENASAVGAPGTAIPGLPEIPASPSGQSND